MRRMVTREITHTKVKIAKMVVENGVPTAQPLEDKILLGNVQMEKAQKLVSKEYGQGVTVFGVEAETLVYQLPVEEFLALATVREAGDEDSEQEELSL